MPTVTLISCNKDGTWKLIESVRVPWGAWDAQNTEKVIEYLDETDSPILSSDIEYVGVYSWNN